MSGEKGPVEGFLKRVDGIDVGLIIARSVMGGRNLYYGVPNVKRCHDRRGHEK